MKWGAVCLVLSNVVQCAEVWCSLVHFGIVWFSVVQCSVVWCSGVQCGAVWYSVV